MRKNKLDEYIDHMVDALQRDHETNAVTWARLAEQEIQVFDEHERIQGLDISDDELIGDYWEGYFYGDD